MRVGFIGGGTIGQWHAERVRSLGHDVAAIADIDPEVRELYRTEYGADATFEDYEDLIERGDVDVVAVTVPNALHADCAVAALEADLNVLVEKPLADTLAGARRIETAAEASDGTVMVGFMKAFDPAVEAVLDPVENGEFGEVYEVDVEYVRRRGIPQIGSWFTRNDVAGGGAVVDIGPHMLHLALLVLGFPRVESVAATTGTHFGNEDDYTYLDMWGGDPVEGGTFDVEDHARALIRTESGVVHLNVAWASNREPVQKLQVLGSDAGATIAEDEPPVVHGTRGDALTTETLETESADTYEREWSYFFDVLAGEREHDRNTLAEGVAVQAVIEAIYESGDQGRTVDL